MDAQSVQTFRRTGAVGLTAIAGLPKCGGDDGNRHLNKEDATLKFETSKTTLKSDRACVSSMGRIDRRDPCQNSRQGKFFLGELVFLARLAHRTGFWGHNMVNIDHFLAK
jgi:hypothetical protein